MRRFGFILAILFFFPMHSSGLPSAMANGLDLKSEWQKLNPEERKVFRSNPFHGVFVSSCATLAREQSQSQFPQEKDEGSLRDAFRHTYWNAIMTITIGAKSAKAWSDAHEYGDPDFRAGDSKSEIRRAMDLANNAYGIRIGIAFVRARAKNFFIDPQNWVHEAVLKSLERGKLVFTTGPNEHALELAPTRPEREEDRVHAIGDEDHGRL